MRLTTAAGRCFEATFTGCRRNDTKKILCKASCQARSLPPVAEADRTIVLDMTSSSPWIDRFRAFNHDVQVLPAGSGRSGTDSCAQRGIELIDRMFDPRPGRRVRLWFKTAHWPALGFDASCQWTGGPTVVLDELVTAYAATGAEIELVLLGQPAAFSSDCSGSCTGRMKPGGGCTCGDPGEGFVYYTPHAYSPEWKQHWKCVLKHYAALGVRRFEIWNEPDGSTFFRGAAGSLPSTWEDSFIEMFEQMRLALEEARDELDPAVRDAITIGGPAMSEIDGVIGDPPGPDLPSMPRLLDAVALGSGDADLDFVSLHFYTADPGDPFAEGVIDLLRSYVPAGWSPVGLDINEWNIGLGLQHPCQDADGDPANGWTAPEAGQDSSAGCDHRGAGYAAYMLSGFATQPDDVRPYVFEPLANGFSERCDMLESSLGIFTKHGLPKPMAAVHWAISQMDWRLLDARQERLTDRSLGWIASLDQQGVVHLLIGQFDSTQLDHFVRHYSAAGHDADELIPGCGCESAPQPFQCVLGKLQTALSDPDPCGRFSADCPGLDSAAACDAIDAFLASQARVGLEGIPATVALDVRGLPCRRRFTVEVFTTGPGQSTAAIWRQIDGPHRQAAACTDALAASMDSFGYDWEALQDELWEAIRTPTASYSVKAGESIPSLTVPAYGAVYVRIY